jgi:hypothetical protein
VHDPQRATLELIFLCVGHPCQVGVQLHHGGHFKVLGLVWALLPLVLQQVEQACMAQQ